jgi:hypothetical protein
MIALSPLRINAMHYLSADLHHAHTEVMLTLAKESNDKLLNGITLETLESKQAIIKVLSGRPEWSMVDVNTANYQLGDLTASVWINMDEELMLAVHELDND